MGIDRIHVVIHIQTNVLLTFMNHQMGHVVLVVYEVIHEIIIIHVIHVQINQLIHIIQVMVMVQTIVLGHVILVGQNLDLHV
jgi:hypothetical protein